MIVVQVLFPVETLSRCHHKSQVYHVISVVVTVADLCLPSLGTMTVSKCHRGLSLHGATALVIIYRCVTLITLIPGASSDVSDTMFV